MDGKVERSRESYENGCWNKILAESHFRFDLSIEMTSEKKRLVLMKIYTHFSTLTSLHLRIMSPCRDDHFEI